MTQITTAGLSAIAKSHEKTMTALFNLTIRQPRKIQVKQITEEITLGTQDGTSYNCKPTEYYGGKA